MQEDKHLKELLMKWALENPSANFTSEVMQRVTSGSLSNLHTFPSLLKQRLPRILLSIFILVCMVLLALCFTILKELPFQFTMKLPVQYFSQCFSFLIAFWIVMLLNLAVKKYTVHYSQHSK